MIRCSLSESALFAIQKQYSKIEIQSMKILNCDPVDFPKLISGPKDFFYFNQYMRFVTCHICANTINKDVHAHVSRYKF